MNFLEQFVVFYIWTYAFVNSNVWAWLSVYSSLCQRPHYHLFALVGWCEITTVTLPFFVFFCCTAVIFSSTVLLSLQMKSLCALLIQSVFLLGFFVSFLLCDMTSRLGFNKSPKLYSRRLTPGQVGHAEALDCWSQFDAAHHYSERTWLVCVTKQLNTATCGKHCQMWASLLKGQQSRAQVLLPLSIGDYHHVSKGLHFHSALNRIRFKETKVY